MVEMTRYVDFIKRNASSVLISGILIASLLLRLHHLTGFSLSNDELSALARLQYDKISELIRFGIMSDGHPAGVQLFLYFWTNFFGLSEYVVRFPFAIAGTLAVWFSFLAGRKMFGTATGLMVAGLIAFLEFPLLYSQLARPYSTGLAAVMFTTWAWAHMIDPDKKDRGMLIPVLYTLGIVSCLYNHYFTILFALLNGFAGLFMLRKETMKPYTGSWIAALFIFIPHLKITFTQLGYGGLGTWLGPPESDFWLDHILYIFNNSGLVAGMSLVVAINAAIFLKSGVKINKWHWASLFFFITPMFLGYWYSVRVNPILQHSILIFTFPFLLFFLFSFAGNKVNWLSVFMISVLIMVSASNTLWASKYYQSQKFGDFRFISSRLAEWNSRFGNKGILLTANVNNPYYLKYYLNQTIKGQQVNLTKTSVRSDAADLGKMIRIVNESKSSYFAHVWSTRFDPYEVFEIIRSRYPVVVEDTMLFNSRATLFSRGDTTLREIIFRSVNRFESPVHGWTRNESGLDSLQPFSDRFSFRLDSLTEYSPTFSIPVNEIFMDTSNTLNVKLKYRMQKGAKGTLVVAFERGEESIDWYGLRLDEFSPVPGKWHSAIISRRMPIAGKMDDHIKVFVWNNGKKAFNIDDFEVVVYKDSRFNYR